MLIKICTKFHASLTIWTIFLLTSSLATEIEFFLMAILTKDFILDVSQGFEYANEYGCKIFAKWLGPESIEIKGFIGTEKVMPCLHVRVFISFSVWFFKHEDNFYHFLHYILSFMLQYCRCQE